MHILSRKMEGGKRTKEMHHKGYREKEREMEKGRESVYLCGVCFDWWAALGSTHEGKVDPGLWLLEGYLQPECVREKGGEERGEVREGKRRGGRGKEIGGRWKVRRGGREERNAIKCRPQRTLVM